MAAIGALIVLLAYVCLAIPLIISINIIENQIQPLLALTLTIILSPIILTVGLVSAEIKAMYERSMENYLATIKIEDMEDFQVSKKECGLPWSDSVENVHVYEPLSKVRQRNVNYYTYGNKSLVIGVSPYQSNENNFQVIYPPSQISEYTLNESTLTKHLTFFKCEATINNNHVLSEMIADLSPSRAST